MKPIQWNCGGPATGNDAPTWPRHGERRKRVKLARLVRISLTLALLGVLASACDGASQPAAPASQAPASQTPASQAPATAAADCSTQADREAFIEKQMAEGLWPKVGQAAKVFHVHVSPAFLAETPPDEQRESLAVISAYSKCAGGSGRVLIHDATTGEKIGQFSDAGLELK